MTSAVGAGVAFRGRLYDEGHLTVHRAPGPVISVGNLAMGGQGKTPLVSLLLRWFGAAGVRPAVVSRGYGRRARTPVLVSVGAGPRCTPELGGDEPVMLARQTAAVVVVDPDRVRGARRAFELGAEVVILDDGFQHRRLHRDLDLVVLGEPPPPLAPLGRGREPLSALGRGHLAVLTAPELRLTHVPRWGSVYGRFVAIDHVAADGSDARSMADLRGRPVAALTGIARPDRVLETLRSAGARVVHREARPDHGRLTGHQRRAFDRRARDRGAELLMTTEKDAERWGAVADGLRVVRVQLRFGGPAAARLAEAVVRTTGISLPRADSVELELLPASV